MLLAGMEKRLAHLFVVKERDEFVECDDVQISSKGKIQKRMFKKVQSISGEVFGIQRNQIVVNPLPSVTNFLAVDNNVRPDAD